MEIPQEGMEAVENIAPVVLDTLQNTEEVEVEFTEQPTEVLQSEDVAETAVDKEALLQMKAEMDKHLQVKAEMDAYLQNKQSTSTHQAPSQPSPTTPPEAVEEKGWLDSVKETSIDVMTGLSAGVMEAGNDALEFGHVMGNSLLAAMRGDWDNVIPQSLTEKEKQDMFRLDPIHAQTTTGQFVEEITTFATTFVGVGKVMKAKNLLQGSNAIVKGAVQGGITDLINVDVHEDRLSNLIESVPALSNPISQYLASEKDESWLTAKTKGVLEGMLLGGMIDSTAEAITYGVKKLKQLKGAKTQDEVIEILEEEAPTVVAQNTQEGTTAPVRENTTEGQGIQETTPNASASVPQDVTPTPPTKPRKPIIKDEDLYSPSQVQKWAKEASTADEAITEKMDSMNFRRVAFETPQGSQVLYRMSNALAENTLRGKGRESLKAVSKRVKRHLNKTVKELEDSGFTGMREYIGGLADNVESVRKATLELQTARNMHLFLIKEANILAKKIDSGIASEAEKVQAVLIAKDIQEMHVAIADMKTTQARSLKANQLTATDKTQTKADPDYLAKMYNVKDVLGDDDASSWLVTNGYDPVQLQNLARDIVLMEGNTAGVSKRLQKVDPKATVGGILNEVRINGILSGTATHTANIIGGMMKSVTIPTSRIIGGALTLDKQSMQHGMRHLMAMSRFTMDALQLAGKAFRNDSALLDSVVSKNDTTFQHISYDGAKSMMKQGEDGTLSPVRETIATGVDKVGKIINFPTRLLMTADEFFKQLTARSELYASLYDEAIGKGMTKTDDINKYVNETFDSLFVDDTMVRNNELTERALKKAREATWTTPLAPQSVAAGWVRMGKSAPILRILTPFVRTPINIFNDFVNHSPLAPLREKVRERMAQGGIEKSEAVGEMALGASAIYGAYLMASEGLITGSPPKSTKELERLQATGWRPYSIKIGDKYYSYRRIDPVGMFLGMTADITTIASDEYAPDSAIEEASGALIAAFAENLFNKTYMTGITDILNVIQDPDRYAQGYTPRLLSSYIPYSSAMRDITKYGYSPSMKETRGFVDTLLSSIPSYNDKLPKRYDWLTGNDIDPNPVFISKEVNDVVLDELAHLGNRIMGKPPRELMGIELSNEQYSRLSWLHGNIKVKGRSLYETLETLFSHPQYDIERNTFGDAIEGMGEDDPRAIRVNKIISDYRDKAKRQLFREFPELAREVTLKKKQENATRKRQLHTGNQDALLEQLKQY